MSHRMFAFSVAVALLLGSAGAADDETAANEPEAEAALEAPAAPEASPVPGVRAPQRRPAMGRLFELADTNKDGKVSYEDLKNAAPNFPESAFERLDADKDGFLTREEVRAAEAPGGGPAEMMRRMIQRADQNRDGKVTREEFEEAFPNAPAERFERLDSNKDGVLDSQDEIVLPGGRPGARPGPRRDAGPEARREGRPGGAPQDVERRRGQVLLERADKDGDGKVTRGEFAEALPNAPAERFDMLDRNGDGVLTVEDFQGGPPARSGRSSGRATSPPV